MFVRPVGFPFRRLVLPLSVLFVILIAACAPVAAPPPAAPPAVQPTAAAATQPAAATQAPAAATQAPAATQPAATTAAQPPSSSLAAPVATAASRPNLSGELTINTWRDISADPKHPSYTVYLLIEQWKKNHPNVTVKYQPMLGTVPELFGFITTNLRSKTLGDVVMQYFPSPAQLDPDLQHDFTPDLAKPNPYSTNPTWKDDFPLNGAAFRDVTVDGKVLMVATTYVGDLGDTAILYNKEVLQKAGITELPKTWADFMADLKKLKDAGFQPWYMPTVGNEQYIFSWYMAIIGDQVLGDTIKQCDGQAGDPADGHISQKEATYCIKKGFWSSSSPGVKQQFEIMKDWSQYWHEGYLAPPAPGNRFVEGKTGFYSIVRINMPFVENDPNVKFDWGSFYLPPLKGTAGTPEGNVRRVGNAGAGQGSQFFFIPKTTEENGKLELALDLLQYMTSPDAEKYWCSIQSIPCYEPGTAVDKIFPDKPVLQEHYRGFLEPSALNDLVSGLDINNAFGQAVSVQEIKVFQDYLAGTTTLDQALEQYQALLTQLADNTIKQHPEWNADKW